ncbi:MAG: hypothetical protein DMG38_00780 [Acidobacteria bacterium]|nr:MAG: hypothetical protein DMG38_00780 [Acidobacteriota bacterium]
MAGPHATRASDGTSQYRPDDAGRNTERRASDRAALIERRSRYHDGVFIAFHGSWNRAPYPQGGYNVVFAQISSVLRLRHRPCQPARPLLSTLLEGKRQNRVAAATGRARYALSAMDRQPSAPPVAHSADARSFTKGPPPPAAG